MQKEKKQKKRKKRIFGNKDERGTQMFKRREIKNGEKRTKKDIIGQACREQEAAGRTESTRGR